MLLALYKLLSRLLPATLCSTVLAISGIASQPCPAQSSTQSTSDLPVYLPSGENDAPLMISTASLRHLGEPSLLETAKDVGVRAFRVSYKTMGREVAVRLVINADGSGQVTSAVCLYSKKEVERTQASVSAADVDKFLKFVEKIGFWSKSSTHLPQRETDEAGRRVYVMDGIFWMAEGVQNGSFHYLYGLNPSPNPINELGCYLARVLAKSDSIPMPGCTSRR